MLQKVKQSLAAVERTPGRVAEHAAEDAGSALPARQDQAHAAISPRAWFRAMKGAAPAADADAPPAGDKDQAAVAAAPAGDEEAEAAAAEAPAAYEGVAAAKVPAAAVKPSSKEGKVLHPDLINPNILKTQYAVRGEIYLKAEEMRRAGREVIFTNIGNPHNLGAHPITFTRQVVALCAAPFLLEDPRVLEIFPSDVIERATKLVGCFSGGIGAYSDSRGNIAIRQEVADFIEKRDGFPANPEHIFLTDGASPAVRMVLNTIIRDKDDAILVPIPQYPLYSAAIQLLGGTLVPYHLDETHGWALCVESLRKAVEDARADGKCVRALVFINPGNPTGQCLPLENLRELVRFCLDERVLLMADEVYQELVYQDEHPFVAARKVLMDMGEPYSSGVELVSFHTVSKGTSGECGLRGGYYEMVNLHPGTIEQLYKISSINLSPNSVGQIAMSCYIDPPTPGQPSYELWKQEREGELTSLRRRAHMVTDGFNSLKGVECNFTEGAMYSFPHLFLPPRAVAAAKAAGKAPDAYYCLRLLDATGIVTVPGCGFGQEEGTFHLRTTILPREEKMAEFVEKFRQFHEAFMAEFDDE